VNAPESAPDTAAGGHADPLLWRFDRFVYDEARRILIRDGRELVLQRKPLDVLAFLLHHAGEVVTKDELAQALWTRTVVDDAVIAKAVGKLRAALGDSEREIIRTVLGIGFQLVAPVQLEARRSEPVQRLALKPGDSPPGREHWCLERCLGRGGYGEVWLVRHRHTKETRAYKFALDATALSALKREITLFRLLRETLGERPDIQPLLDWNVSVPPFFLESPYLADGSLPQWAEAQGGLSQVPLATRLDMAAQVADALAAIHAVGVLHKDLKPANVIVESLPSGQLQCRLSDFGTGRVLDAAQLEQCGITRLGFTQAAQDASGSSGTPMYLPPEALAGQPLTLKSDLYALGVMLYQMIVGDFSKPLASGWARDIDDELLREDVAACVDGDPERRLGDAAQLALRLRSLDERQRQRLKAIEQARAAEAMRRRLEALHQRWRWTVSISAALALGLASTLVFYVKARHATELAAQQTRLAERQARVAETVSDFLRKDLLAGANPELSGQQPLSVRELVDAAAQSARRRFAEEPGLEAALRTTLGQLYRGLADYRQSRLELEQAVALLQQQGAGAAIELAAARLALGETLLAQTEYAQASNVFDDVIRMSDTGLVGAEPGLAAQISRAEAQTQLGQVEQSLIVLGALVRQIEAAGGTGDALWLQAQEHRGNALLRSGRTEASLSVFEDVSQRTVERYGDDHLRSVAAQIDLGAVLIANARSEAAIPVLAAARDAALATVGPSHYEALRAVLYLARAHFQLDQDATARRLLEAALPHAQANFGEASRLSRLIRNDLANVAGDQGRFDEALAQYDKLIESWQQELGADTYRRHFERFSIEFNVAATLNQAQRWSESSARLRPVLDDARELFGDMDARSLGMSLVLAEALMHTGDSVSEAAELLDRMIAQLSGVPDRAAQTTLERARALRAQLAG